MQRPQLVAIDTNILLALGEADEDTEDALQLILRRAAPVQILLCPTVLQETSYLAANGITESQRRMARSGLAKAPAWKLHPSTLNAAQHAIATNAARKLMEHHLLPAAELNDARILAEAAVLGCLLLVSQDSHLLEIDAFRLNLVMHELDLSVPVISTPRDLIRRFYR